MPKESIRKSCKNGSGSSHGNVEEKPPDGFDKIYLNDDSSAYEVGKLVDNKQQGLWVKYEKKEGEFEKTWEKYYELNNLSVLLWEKSFSDAIIIAEYYYSVGRTIQISHYPNGMIQTFGQVGGPNNIPFGDWCEFDSTGCLKQETQYNYPISRVYEKNYDCSGDLISSGLVPRRLRRKRYL